MLPPEPEGMDWLLRCRVDGIGRERVIRKVERSWGNSHQYMLLYTCRGKGHFCSAVLECDLGKGDLLILPPRTAFQYEPIGKQWNVYWLTFQERRGEDVLKEMLFQQVRRLHFKGYEQIVPHFAKLMEVLKQDTSDSAYQASCLLWQLLLQCYFKQKQKLGLSGDLSSRLQLAVNYADIHYREAVTLEQLSDAAGISPEHLCRCFRRQMQMRPLEYIACKRIQEAKRLLWTTELEIAEIGKQVGYDDARYFQMVFSRHTGMSPLQFRGERL